MSWYLAVLKKYAVFSGRARRKEYWMFFLFNIIIAIVIGIMSAVLETMALFALFSLYSLAIIIPGIAVFVRRLHDIGKSGWWFLIGFVPAIGGIILLVFMCLGGDEGENQYGPNPKLEAE